MFRDHVQEFVKKFEPLGGTLAPPEFPSNFVKKDESGSQEGTPDKLKFNFFMPHDTVFRGEQVDLVLMPAVTGDFGVMPGHVPTVAELRPGLVTVHKELDKTVEKSYDTQHAWSFGAKRMRGGYQL